MRGWVLSRPKFFVNMCISWGILRFPYKFVYFLVITVFGWACAVWLGWVWGLCWVLGMGAVVVVVLVVGLVRLLCRAPGLGAVAAVAAVM